MLDGKFLLQLNAQPFGFRLSVPVGEGEHLHFFMPVTPAGAQSLALALLANCPGLTWELLPEVRESILAEIATRQKADSQFLSAVGIGVA